MGADTTSNKPCPSSKRLILCCDGTWMDSDNGYVKPSLSHPQGTLQVPSNVTRISRCFKRRCSDGKLQIISYESGVGTGSNTLDTITGGAFGLGLTERVREAYSYLCANYIDGDEIVLVGFSRGAFTARSVSGMVGNLGLLTREGVEHFYPIFKDMQNWNNDDYDDPFPDLPFPDKPRGPGAAAEYRARLEKMGYTRWHDTALSDRIEHAFQALALDETRSPFSPAVWERLPENRMTTDLRQVWFPGNHGNIGGGWADQGMANCTLAWMMDQMASVGIEFDKEALDRVFKQSADYYETFSVKEAKEHKRTSTWAIDPIYSKNQPLRPWALGAIKKTTSLLYWFSGQVPRTPGLYKQTDPKTELDRNKFLQDTNERIHSSVRVRLTCHGLGLDDKSVWKCSALEKWNPKRTGEEFKDPIARHASWSVNGGEASAGGKQNGKRTERWVWQFAGDEKDAPTDAKQRLMVEDTLGPYEQYLLKLSGGDPNVYEFAETREVR